MKYKSFLFLFLIILIFSGCKSDGTGETKILITSNERGTLDGYDYEFWKNNAGKGKMILGLAGTFKCEWENGGNGSNILFRSGKRFGSTQTYDKYGNITFTYNADYNPVSPGVSYLSIYGWTQRPLVEFYIVDNYLGGYHPGSSGVKKGSFTIEGEGTYTIYTRDMKQQPAIEGSGRYDFTQYISVRSEKRSSGTISVTKHFDEWKKAGLDMSGKLYETMMKVEGYNSSGSAEITENTLTITK